MAKDIIKRFMHLESTQIPLEEVNYEAVKENCIDPVTGKPYKGIILFGCFADLSNENPNNNQRYYDVEQYLLLLGELRKKVFDGKGVYGELEHPKGYAVNFNNVSHKILDVYYDPASQKVYGYVLLLNTETGKKAQEIVRSGGKLAISGRAAGEEVAKKDGSKMAYVKLLTTYDLVCHPGFSTAVLSFKELNESQQFEFEKENRNRKFSYILYDEDVRKLNESYEHFLEITGGKSSESFLTWLGESQQELSPSEKEQEKEDEEKLQNNQNGKQQQLEDELKDAAQKDLQEAQKEKVSRKRFYNRLKEGQRRMQARQRYNNEDKAVYDNSAGFVTEGISK